MNYLFLSFKAEIFVLPKVMSLKYWYFITALSLAID